MTKKKESKKNLKKNNQGYNSQSENPITSLFKIVIIIVIAFALFYALTYVVTKHKKNYVWENNEMSSVIQYDKIMLGTLLTQSESEYYVLAYDYSDDNKDIYETYISMYTSKKDSIKIYTSDLASDFNKKYIADKSNFNFDNVKDLKVKQITLFKIKDSKIIDYYEGNDKVIEEFKKMVK